MEPRVVETAGDRAGNHRKGRNVVKQETYEEEEPMPQGTRVYFDPEDGTLYAAQNEPIRVEVPGLIEALGRLAAVLEGNAERLDRRLRAIEDSIERSGV